LVAVVLAAAFSRQFGFIAHDRGRTSLISSTSSSV